MKRLLQTLVVSFGFAALSHAQSNPSKELFTEGYMKAEVHKKVKSNIIEETNSSKEAITTYWTEDFAGGIPQFWQNLGYTVDPVTGSRTFNSLCGWEYRGSSTTPNNSIGSRGAFAAQVAGNPNSLPLASATTSNGFIIFDSDFKDNAGSATGAGSGVCPAPHIGVLITDTIDLGASGAVEIVMTSGVRHYSTNYFVAASADGGVTFPDTVQFLQDVESNSTHLNPQTLIGTLPSYVNGQSDVVLAIIYDGTPELQTTSGPAWGYYYWMLDDLEIRDLIPNFLSFTDAVVNGLTAPRHDIIYDGGSPWPHYGNHPLHQAVPLSFDSNILNEGAAAQTNVTFKVDIVNSATNTVVTTLSSNAIPTLAAGDTADFTQAVTSGAWTPSSAGEYDIVFYMESDSIPISNNFRTEVDTFRINITDSSQNNGRYSLDWNVIDNFVGTNSSASGDIIAMGIRLHTPNSHPDSAGYELFEHMQVTLSNLTDTTAQLNVEIYDTTGFTFATGFTGSPLFSRNYLVTADDVANNLIDLNMQSSNGTSFAVPDNKAYFAVLNMTPNAVGGVVRIANNATWSQPGTSSIYNTGAANWFTGFSNSNNFEAPYIRMITGKNSGIGLEENILSKGILSIFPNPSEGILNIDIEEAGNYELMIFNMDGKMVVMNEINSNGNEVISRDFSTLSSGTYVVYLNGSEISKTTTITVK